MHTPSTSAPTAAPSPAPDPREPASPPARHPTREEPDLVNERDLPSHDSDDEASGVFPDGGPRQPPRER